MACQLVSIQVEKVFTQNLGKTDAQSITRDWKVKVVLLTLNDGAAGAASGSHSGETSKR